MKCQGCGIAGEVTTPCAWCSGYICEDCRLNSRCETCCEVKEGTES